MTMEREQTDGGYVRTPAIDFEDVEYTALSKADGVVEEIVEEYLRATKHFQPMRSPHEGLAIILEEYKELEAEVFKQHDVRTKEKMRHKAMQVAAMALRFMVDLT